MKIPSASSRCAYTVLALTPCNLLVLRAFSCFINEECIRIESQYIGKSSVGPWNILSTNGRCGEKHLVDLHQSRIQVCPSDNGYIEAL